MGLIRLDHDLDNFVTPQHSQAKGPVVRGQATELSLVQLDEGEGANTHAHAEEQWVYVLAGTLRVTLGDETYDVGPGEASYHPSNVPHGSVALETVRALSFKNVVDPQYAATTEVG